MKAKKNRFFSTKPGLCFLAGFILPSYLHCSQRIAASKLNK